jgi:lipopolysaccharide transport system ATP-binding protein
MAAIKRLCKRGILLQNGTMVFDGEINEVADKYLTVGIGQPTESSWPGVDAPGNDKITIRKAKAFAIGKKPTDPIKTSDEIKVEIEFENKQNDVDLDVTWDIFDVEMIHVCHIGTLVGDGEKINTGSYRVSFTIPANLLNNKRYNLNVLFGVDQRYIAYSNEGILSIDIEDGLQRQGASFHQYPGVIHPSFVWKKEKLNDQPIFSI